MNVPVPGYDRILEDDQILEYGGKATADRVTNRPVLLAQRTGKGQSKKAKKASTQLSIQQQAENMVQELIPIFEQKFSKKRVTLGRNIGRTVPVTVVSDKDMEAELTKHAKRLANDFLNIFLKYANDRACDRLEKFYKNINQTFDCSKVDENYKPTREERIALISVEEAALIIEVRRDINKTSGFYSRAITNSDIGKMFISKSIGSKGIFKSVLAGTIAHEMAHAYAEPFWDEFLNAMWSRGMKDTGLLNEGMACHIEKIVTNEWINNQKTNMVIPGCYRDQPIVQKRANEFIRAVGQDSAYEAYFAGTIDFDPEPKEPLKPEDTIKIGKKKKSWKWPWR